MNRNELIDHIAFTERELAYYKQLNTGCSTCEHFANGYCRQHQGNPPPDFIASGCADWNFDDVPF